jgi:hypothetical protein
MKLLRLAFLSLGLLQVARAADEPGMLLGAGADEGEWKPLIASLAAKGTILAPFTELRFFPFRREAMQLEGTLRISPERGLSLQYLKPDANVLIADSSGLLLKDRRGAREMPAGSHQSGAVAALLPIMRFDFPALYPRFLIRASGTPAAWKFQFIPKDPEVAGSLGQITVEGAGNDVTHLEFRRSAKQRIEIEVGATRSGVPFTPAELAQFFR